MKKLGHHDGSWGNVLTQWSTQCHKYSEDFESYAPETMKLLGELAEETANERWDGVFGFFDDNGSAQGVCFVNGAFVPGFTGRVLRVRHVLLSPENDFGAFEEEHYATLLGRIFERIMRLSDTTLPCGSVKIHFRSPADVAIFRKFPDLFAGSEHFEAVQMVGAWLILRKKTPIGCI